MVHLRLEAVFDITLQLVDLGRTGHCASGRVGSAGEFPGHHLRKTQGITGNAAVTSVHAGGGLLAFHGGKAHLTAGHAEVGVVHNDNSYVFIAVCRVEGFRDSYVVGVAVALVGYDEDIRIDPLHAGGHCACPSMGTVEAVAFQACTQIGGTSHSNREDDVITLLQFIQTLHDEAAYDSVAASRTEVHWLIHQNRDFSFFIGS